MDGPFPTTIMPKKQRRCENWEKRKRKSPATQMSKTAVMELKMFPSIWRKTKEPSTRSSLTVHEDLA